MSGYKELFGIDRPGEKEAKDLQALVDAACLALDALRALQDDDDGGLVSPARNALSRALGEGGK